MHNKPVRQTLTKKRLSFNSFWSSRDLCKDVQIGNAIKHLSNTTFKSAFFYRKKKGSPVFFLKQYKSTKPQMKTDHIRKDPSSRTHLPGSARI